MATVASLNVLLKSNTKQLTTGLNKAAGGIKSFAVKLIAIKVGFDAASRASRAFFESFNEQRQAIDALGKLSKNTALAVEDLQALKLIGDEGGIGFTQLSKGLKAFTKRMGEAAQGTGEAKAALEGVLGLDPGEIVKLSAGEGLRTVLTEIDKLPSAAEKSAVFAKVFSDVGKEFSAAFTGGGQQIDDVLARLEEMDVVLDQVDVSGVELLNDTLGLSQVGITGLVQKLTTELAPGLIVIVRRIQDWAKELGGVGTIATKVVNFLAEGFVSVANVINGVRGVIKGIQSQFLLFLEKLTFGIRTINKINFEIAKVTSRGDLTGFSQSIVQGAFDAEQILKPLQEEFAASSKELRGEMNELFQGLEAPKFLDGFLSDLAKVRDEIDELANETIELTLPPALDVAEGVAAGGGGGSRSASAIGAVQKGSAAAISRIAEIFNQQDRSSGKQQDVWDRLLVAVEDGNALTQQEINLITKNGVVIAPVGAG